MLRLDKVVARNLHHRLGRRSERKAMVSFTFDDFPRSAWTTGAELLQEQGIRGTYYAALGLMGKRTPVGEMFEGADLQALVASGHEIGCHTYDHVLCRGIGRSQLLANCHRNRLFLRELLQGYELRQFSFPQGVVTAAAKEALNDVYASCRTIEPGVNSDPVDLGFLRANHVYGSTSLTKLQKMIYKNQKHKTWLIFYTHDVSPRPSPWGCTPEQLRVLVTCARNVGAEILPIGEAVSGFFAAP